MYVMPEVVVMAVGTDGFKWRSDRLMEDGSITGY